MLDGFLDANARYVCRRRGRVRAGDNDTAGQGRGRRRRRFRPLPGVCGSSVRLRRRGRSRQHLHIAVCTRSSLRRARRAHALRAIASRMFEAENELGRIDAVAGDGDHGRGMVRGTEAASAAADSRGPTRRRNRFGIGRGRRSLGSESRRHVGRVVGRGAVRAGRRLGDHGTPTDLDVASALRAGHDALVELGGASRGDKTMLDALAPFVEAVEAAVGRGIDWRSAWLESVDVASKAAAGTADLRPEVGRARPLAERSLGTPDAGAISLVMCIDTVAGSFQNEGTSR